MVLKVIRVLLGHPVYRDRLALQVLLDYPDRRVQLEQTVPEDWRGRPGHPELMEPRDRLEVREQLDPLVLKDIPEYLVLKAVLGQPVLLGRKATRDRRVR